MHSKCTDFAPNAAGLAIDILPGLLAGVYRMARAIHQTVQLVILNEEKCFFLNKRIQNLIGILYRLKPDIRYLPPLIMSFQSFPHECLVFLQTFFDVSLLDRI
ncbi:hypothetical protein I4U23_027278 [Adineta vaga]|nr:hypothetical protein I4U23_027278 [Adineta vaga]